MFVEAIKEVGKYTRPIHTVTRTFKDITHPGASTLFFVNENAIAVTCKHVAEIFVASDKINARFNSYKKELTQMQGDPKLKHNTKQLEGKYGYKSDTTMEVINTVINSFDTLTGIECQLHPTLDLAIIEFKGVKNILYSSYATFVKDSTQIQPGRYLCRLGFPFPVYDNFEIDRTDNKMQWTSKGVMHTQTFPMDGIVTRFFSSNDAKGQPIISHIEMSTPGLKGQSGGPLFDSSGLIYGMQSITSHHHLGFDLKNHAVMTNGKKSLVDNHPFLHVGVCIHADRIKEFLTEKNIKFYEG